MFILFVDWRPRNVGEVQRSRGTYCISFQKQIFSSTGASGLFLRKITTCSFYTGTGLKARTSDWRYYFISTRSYSICKEGKTLIVAHDVQWSNPSHLTQAQCVMNTGDRSKNCPDKLTPTCKDLKFPIKLHFSGRFHLVKFQGPLENGFKIFDTVNGGPRRRWPS